MQNIYLKGKTKKKWPAWKKITFFIFVEDNDTIFKFSTLKVIFFV